MPISSDYQKFKNKGGKDTEEESFEVIDPRDEMVISYLTLRRILGILGIALPFVLVILSLVNKNLCGILPSISDYYHTSVRNIFVIIISAMGIFFLTFNVKNKFETVLYRIAGLLALGIVLAPTNLKDNVVVMDSKLTYDSFVNNCYSPSIKAEPLISGIHYFSATLFFVVLIILVLCFFKKEEITTDNNPTRIRLYNLCGYGMMISILLIALFEFVFPDTFKLSTYTFETTALIFFGIAWLVKGDVTLKEIGKYFHWTSKE